MLPSILITRRVFPEVVTWLKQHCEVEYRDDDSTIDPHELAERAMNKQGLLTMLTDKVDQRLLDCAPNLKVVSNVAVGYNNFDIQSMTLAGVLATNTPDVLTETTADTAWALMMASARKVAAADAWVRTGQ